MSFYITSNNAILGLPLPFRSLYLINSLFLIGALIILLCTWPNHPKRLSHIFSSIGLTLSLIEFFFNNIFPCISILTLSFQLQYYTQTCCILTTQHSVPYSITNLIKVFIYLNTYLQVLLIPTLHPSYSYPMIHILFNLFIFMNYPIYWKLSLFGIF